MTKPTKKELRAVMTPLRKAAERYGAARMRGDRCAPPADVEWRGLKLGVTFLRRARVVCNVPAPYSMLEIHYEAFADGKRVVSWPGVPNFVDVVFKLAARGDLTLADA